MLLTVISVMVALMVMILMITVMAMMMMMITVIVMMMMKLMTLTAMCTFAPETGLIARPHPASQSSDLKRDDVERY